MIVVYLLIMAVIIIWSLMGGWTISILWSWFIVPKFGLPPINWATGTGLSLIMFMLKGNISLNDKEPNIKEALNMVYEAFFIPLLVIGMGAIIRYFTK